MKKIIAIIFLALASITVADAQALNKAGDNIIGEYYTDYGGSASRFRFTKESDGSYKAQIFWVEDLLDKNGKVSLDEKNPDKSLRNVPMDKVVIVRGLKYNAKKQRWEGGKIYDPTRGLVVNATASFIDEKNLKIRGTVLGIGESVVWTKEK